MKSEIDQFFEMFWFAGMVKVNKKKARQIFIKLAKKEEDSHSFTEKLILDVQKRLEIRQLGFNAMHPTTYLNGERWEDEYRGQVDEKNNGHKQSFADRQKEQAKRAMQAMESGNGETDIGNIRQIR